MTRLIVWLALGAVVVGAVASLLGSGPERIRALLLFPLGFGLLTGGGLAFAAREFGVRPRWMVTVLSCFVVAGGLIIVARSAYRELSAMARDRVREDGTLVLGLRLLEDQAAADPAQLKSYLELRMAVDPRFEDYLMGRVSALGIWQSPWPVVIWGAEVLLATGAAGWLVWRMTGIDATRKAGAPGSEKVESTEVGTGPVESGTSS